VHKILRFCQRQAEAVTWIFPTPALAWLGKNQSMFKLRPLQARKLPSDKRGWGAARLAGLLAIVALIFSVCVIAYVATQLL
jgi:hypothetical protein